MNTLICVTTMLLNITGQPFTQNDYNVLTRAQKVCEESHNGCVTKFQKRPRQTYRILCGEKQEFSKKELDKYEHDMIRLELKELGDSPETIEKKMKLLEE